MVGGHVQRGHRHDQDHHDLHRDERDHRDGHVRASEHVAQARRGTAIGVLVVARGHVGEGVRVRSQGDEGQDRGRADEDDRDEVRPGEVRQAERGGERRRWCREVRADDGADGRAPHDGAQGGPAASPREQVGGDVARQLVGRVAEADEDGADEQDRQRHEDDADRRHERAEDPRRVAHGQADPAAAADHHLREHHGADRRAEHDRGAWRPAPGRGPGEPLGDDRGHGDGRDVAGAAESDARDQRPQRPTPQAIELVRAAGDGRVHGGGQLGRGGGHVGR